MATLLAYDPRELEQDYHWAKDGRMALDWAGEAQELALRKRTAPAKPPNEHGHQFVPSQRGAEAEYSRRVEAEGRKTTARTRADGRPIGN